MEPSFDYPTFWSGLVFTTHKGSTKKTGIPMFLSKKRLLPELSMEDHKNVQELAYLNNILFL